MKRKKNKNLIWNGLSCLLLIMLMILSMSIIAMAKESYNVNVDGIYYYPEAFKELENINASRAAAGLTPLKLDPQLTECAMQRAAEITVDFSHTRPDGSDCSTVSTRAHGENISVGNISAEGAHESWMNSPRHRSNILSSNYKSVGIGYFNYKDGGPGYWVLIFSRDEAKGTVSEPANRKVSAPVTIVEESFSVRFNLNQANEQPRRMKIGDTFQLSPDRSNPGWGNIYGSLSPDSFIWTSTNPDAATITSGGKVTARGIGDATIIIRPKSYASGKNAPSVSFKISVKKDISKAQISKIPSYDYTGKAICPSVTVKDQGITLKKDTDYTVSYANNIRAGLASVIITGKGNYMGTLTKKFTINRKPVIIPNRQMVSQVTTQLLHQVSDSSLKNTSFYPLRAKASKVTASSIRLSWKSVSGAKKYLIFGKACSAKLKFKKLKEVSTCSYTQKKLKQGKYYKYVVVAVDRFDRVLSISKYIHAATSGGKSAKRVTNAKRVTVSDKSVSLSVGGRCTIKADTVSADKKAVLKKHRGIAYESTNKEIATVSAKGEIRAVSPGKCRIYVYAQNGVYTAIYVTVK